MTQSLNNPSETAGTKVRIETVSFKTRSPLTQLELSKINSYSASSPTIDDFRKNSSWHLGNLVEDFEINIEKFPDAFYHKEGEKQRRVGVMIRYLSFGNIILHDHCYDCQFEIFLDWEPTKVELSRIFAARTATGIDTTMLDYTPWNNIQFTSSIDYHFIEPFVTSKLYYSEYHKKFLLYNSAQIKGTFRENFEVENFPLDCQDLKIILRLGDSAEAIWRHSGICPVNLKVETNNLSVQDYHLYQCYCCYTTTKKKHSAMAIMYAEFHGVIKIRRRWEAYGIRTFVTISVISAGSLASFLIDATSYADRMAHVTTMLLTGVAFTFVVNSSLPVVPYLTFMDKYINAQLLFICLVGAMESFPQLFPVISKNLATTTLAYISLSIWGALHFILLIAGLRFYSIESKKLEIYEPSFPDPIIAGPAHPARNFQTEKYPGEACNIWR